MNKSLADRFWEKVDKDAPNGCWLWTAYCNPSGYGEIGVGGRGTGTILAHRLSYRLAYGNDPGPLCVLHTCDTPACVNPAHLWLGSQADNMADAARKGRSSGGNGRMRKGIAEVVRAARADGSLSQTTLAERFGISQSSVNRILNQQGRFASE